MTKNNSLTVTCNSVNKRINQTDARFNIKHSGKRNGNGGNVTININENGDQSFASQFEPGDEYEITIKKKQ